MKKQNLTEGQEIEQVVRSFQGEAALNFPRAALRYLNAKPCDKLLFKAGPNAILVTLQNIINVLNDPIVADVEQEEINKFISQRQRRRPVVPLIRRSRRP